MIVALIDNGALEPAAHRHLRAVAHGISASTGVNVRAVSWKHSDRVSAESLDGAPAWTVTSFIRSMVAAGQRDFVFIPFFISAQGAIGSSLQRDLTTLQSALGVGGIAGFDFAFTNSLSACGVLPKILAERIGVTVTAQRLVRPAVVLVDHGGPSKASAELRNSLSDAVRGLLAPIASVVVAASMEGDHPPLLAEQLRAAGFAGRDVVVAPIFLSPGRHAGPDGDVVQICRAATAEIGTRCHLAQLVGTHPLVVPTLAAALRDHLSTLHAQPFA